MKTSKDKKSRRPFIAALVSAASCFRDPSLMPKPYKVVREQPLPIERAKINYESYILGPGDILQLS